MFSVALATVGSWTIEACGETVPYHRKSQGPNNDCEVRANRTGWRWSGVVNDHTQHVLGKLWFLYSVDLYILRAHLPAETIRASKGLKWNYKLGSIAYHTVLLFHIVLINHWCFKRHQVLLFSSDWRLISQLDVVAVHCRDTKQKGCLYWCKHRTSTVQMRI